MAINTTIEWKQRMVELEAKRQSPVQAPPLRSWPVAPHPRQADLDAFRVIESAYNRPKR